MFILIETLLSILWLLEHVFDICSQICRCSYTCSKIFWETSLLIYLKNSLVFYSWSHRLKIIKLDEIHMILRVHSEIQLCILLSDHSYFHSHDLWDIVIFCSYISFILDESCFYWWIFSDNITISLFFLICYWVQNFSHSFYLSDKISIMQKCLVSEYLSAFFICLLKFDCLHSLLIHECDLML